MGDERGAHQEHDDDWVSARSHEVFAALRDATPPIVERLAPHGVIDAHHVVGFVHPFSVYVWLATATDVERDAMPGPQPFLDEVRAVIAATGFPAEHATIEGTGVESQETVDRECEGNWWYALR